MRQKCHCIQSWQIPKQKLIATSIVVMYKLKQISMVHFQSQTAKAIYDFLSLLKYLNPLHHNLHARGKKTSAKLPIKPLLYTFVRLSGSVHRVMVSLFLVNSEIRLQVYLNLLGASAMPVLLAFTFCISMTTGFCTAEFIIRLL